MERQEIPKNLTVEEIEKQDKNLEQEQGKTENHQEEGSGVRLSDINQKIVKREEEIQNTQKKINDIRNQLELSPSDEIPPSVQQEQELINKLNQEKVGIEQGSEVVIDSSNENENSEFNLVKEKWRKSAEDRFGIKDFNLEQFKRIVFDSDAVSKTINANGGNWNEVFDNKEKYITGESYEQATKAFEAMEILEEEAPGSVKNLSEKFGIKSFQRYPREILLNQLKEIDPQKEMGILFFAVNDWNGAFDEQGQLWQKIYDNKKDKLNFRIVESKTNIDMARQLIKLKQDSDKKIAFAILSVHSELEGFYLGEGGQGEYVSKEKITELQSNIKESFTDNAQLIGNACSSGAINGWARDISKQSRIQAVGPDQPAAITDVDFVGDTVVPVYGDNKDAYSHYVNGFLLSKKSKKS